MKTNQLMLTFAAALAVSTAFSLPEASDVMLTQDDRGRDVVISYSLSGQSVVTFDLLTNGVSVGGANLVSVSGDLNRIVDAGARSITWRPEGALADVNFSSKRFGTKAVITVWPTNDPPDYVVIDLDGTKARRFYPDADQIPLGVTSDVYKTSKLVMRKIRAAGVRWRMGSPISENGRTAFQTTYWTSATGTKVITGQVLEVPHYVTLTNDYYIGVYELTQDQLKAAIGDAYTTYTSGKLPVLGDKDKSTDVMAYEQVRGHGNNWYCVWPTQGHDVYNEKRIVSLRTLTGVPLLDLPTEAQWEFACRAGTTTAFYGNLESFAADEATLSNRLDRLAWYGGNSGGTAHEVGLKEPNGFGLYDMLGNAWEVCLDGCANPETEQSNGSDQVEPVGLRDGVKKQASVYPIYHVRRGGAADADWVATRCATRALTTYDGNGCGYLYGYRLVAPVNLDETNAMWGVQ